MNPVIVDMFDAFGGVNRLVAMIGAKYIGYSDKEGSNPYINFRHMKGKKTNYLKMTYDRGSDLYNLEFGYVRGHSYSVKATHEGVYADTVREIFEKETCLYLSI